MDRPLLQARRGSSLIEAMILVAVLSVLGVAGRQVLSERRGMGRDLIAYTRAVSLADELMEQRRAGADVRNRPAAFPYRVLEERYLDTPLTKVTVVVDWRRSRRQRGQVKLVSLMRAPP